MNIFQTVKENVTARQAAEQYGLKVNKNGMICCPFHDDRHPSMKVDKGFCCFACGAKGDVITFVADFFHIVPLEAAKKLAEDFRIPIFTDSSKDYLHLLEEWKIRYAPKTPEEEWKAEFIEACQQTEKINYHLDLLVFGELQDRIEFLLDSGKDVKRIEERMEEYRRNNKEQTGRSIGSEGNEL